VAVAPGTSNETEYKVLTHEPLEWRTVFVDRESMLPAYDLLSQEYKLDNPRRKAQYTYPTDIKIEPPYWCRLGLCAINR
jgi:hypothetical protein